MMLLRRSPKVYASSAFARGSSRPAKQVCVAASLNIHNGISSSTSSSTSLRTSSFIVPSGVRTYSSSVVSSAASATTDGAFLPDPSTYVNFDFKTLHDLIEGSCKHYPTHNIFGVRKGDTYEYLTYAGFHELYSTARTLLATEYGVKENDKVAIISNNRIEWAALMYATVSLGAQWVPMYEAQLEKDWRHIVNDSDAKLVIAANMRIYDVVKGYVGKVGNVQSAMCLDTIGEDISFAPLIDKYRDLVNDKKAQPVPALPTLTHDHIATVIYTSGTTGLPKGVELAHRNIASIIIDGKFLLQGHLASNIALTFLPWSHVFGFTNELNTMVYSGSTMALVPRREEILECLAIVKPTVIISVPVFFHKVYDQVQKSLATMSPFRQKLVKAALANSRRRSELLEYGKSVPLLVQWKHNIFDKVIFSKIRDRLGGRLRYAASGGAAADPDVLRFFQDISIPVMEGYGLTETGPVITASSIDWSNRRMGCVGVPLLGQELRIVDPDTLEERENGTDGEICVAGPNVMVGYRKNEKANQEAIFYKDYTNGKGEPKRFFRTGDMGRIIDNKFLKITGRIKEQFKLENGKFVVPAPCEDVFTRGPYISQCMILGANHSHTIALIVPNYVEIAKYAEEHGKAELLANIPYRSVQDVVTLAGSKVPTIEDSMSMPLFQDKQFIELISHEIGRHSANVKNYERPMIWMPLHVPFSPENQMLTQKLSLRRKNVLEVYQPLVDAMYEGKLGNRMTYGRTSPSFDA